MCEALEGRTLFSAALDGIIVFMSDRDGNYEIESMNPDGSNVKNLTNNPALDAIPQVSDDGTMVAFSSDRGHPNQQDVYTMNIDGSGVKNLTPNSPAFDWDPALSPDKTKILFMSDRAGRLDIWVANASDGSNPVNMTADAPYGGDFASWSDDGKQIVYGAYINAPGTPNNEEIFTMDANGAHKKQLTFSAGRDTYPAFTPDGTKIVFTSERDGNREIYIMNAADGSNPVNLTNNPYTDQVPYINEDGDHISFMTYRHGDGEIYIMKIDGTEQTRITNNPAQDAYPGWGESPELPPPPPPVLPNLKINDVKVNEGNTGTTNATFTVSLSAPTSNAVTVAYATADGTATAQAGNDYVAKSGVLSFVPGGPISQSVTVQLKGDYNVETDETYFVNLTSPTNATIADGQGLGTIANDDFPGTLQFSTSQYAVNEGGGSATITVTRNGGVGAAVVVHFATSNGSAVAPGDYTTTSGNLYWAAGDGAAKTFAVPITNDQIVENTESLTLTLSTPAGGASIGAPSSATLTITDNDVPPPPPPPPATFGRIVYMGSVPSGYDIFSANPDGTGVTNLTNNAASDVTPDVSSDGNLIVFASNRADGTQYDIYKMNGNGTNLTRLTSDAATDYYPSINPSKTKIAFLSLRSGTYDVWVMNVDGTGLKNLTADYAGPDFYPTFGLDNRILFSSNRAGGGKAQVYAINPDGTGLVRLTNSTGNDSNAAFSPDGSLITFQSDRDGNTEIYRMNANGTGVLRLTNNAAGDQAPAFSPDGKRIIFHSFRDGNSELYTMNPDGTGVVRVTTNTSTDAYATWGGVPTLNAAASSLTSGTSTSLNNGSAAKKGRATDFLRSPDPLA